MSKEHEQLDSLLIVDVDRIDNYAAFSILHLLT